MSTAVAAALLAAGPAAASLSTLATFVGNNAMSTDGCGSTTQTCTMTINVPTGSTVLAAYLYTSLFSTANPNGAGNTLNGNAVTYTTALGSNGGLQAWRANVTSLVSGIIGTGSAAPFTFTAHENNSAQDGEALVVVYSNGAITATNTIAILDGFSASSGDSSTLTFGTPIDKTVAGFAAEMRLGIGFSYDGDGCTGSGQVSQVTVNGTRITNNAGCNDDSQDGVGNNGNLITVGGDNDPLWATPPLPTTAQDHERYSLINQIAQNSTTITVDTLNPSHDDNIFLEVFAVTGSASVDDGNSVPEPGTLALFGLGLAGLARRWKMKRG